MAGIAGLLSLLYRGRDNGFRSRFWTKPPPSGPAPVAPSPAAADGSGWTRVAAAAEVVPGAPFEARAADQPVVLCRVGGTVHAVGGACPHAGGPLADGALDGSRLTCPLHGWSFDVRTGACEVDPAARLVRFEARERDGAVEVRGPID
jgi:nitrite reductase/ring-hydroxylating ferredoxin subunit